MRARFCVDWDDTLTEDRWPDQGPWLPGAVEALRELERHGDVVIFSCRVAPYAYPSKKFWFDDVKRDPEEVAATVAKMQLMLDDVGLGHIEIWQRPYKPAATVYVDNRAVRFTGNWKEVLEDVYQAIAPIKKLQRGPKLWQQYDPGWPAAILTGVGWPFTGVGWPEEQWEQANPEAVPVDESVYPDEPSSFAEATWPKVDKVIERINRTGRPPVPVRDPFLFQSDPIERHPLSERFHELLREAGDLHDIKQKDYGLDSDPFANVRASSSWGMPSWVGAMVRATDKIRRLQTFARKGELANESVEDAFMDLAVYAIIGRVLFEEES